MKANSVIYPLQYGYTIPSMFSPIVVNSTPTVKTLDLYCIHAGWTLTILNLCPPPEPNMDLNSEL